MDMDTATATATEGVQLAYHLCLQCNWHLRLFPLQPALASCIKQPLQHYACLDDKRPPSALQRTHCAMPPVDATCDRCGCFSLFSVFPAWHYLHNLDLSSSVVSPSVQNYGTA